MKNDVSRREDEGRHIISARIAATRASCHYKIWRKKIRTQVCRFSSAPRFILLPFIGYWHTLKNSLNSLFCTSAQLCTEQNSESSIYISCFFGENMLKIIFIALCDLSPRLVTPIRDLSSTFLHCVYHTRYARALTSRWKKGLLMARIGVTAGLGRQCYKILYDTWDLRSTLHGVIRSLATLGP